MAVTIDCHKLPAAGKHSFAFQGGYAFDLGSMPIEAPDKLFGVSEEYFDHLKAAALNSPTHAVRGFGVAPYRAINCAGLDSLLNNSVEYPISDRRSWWRRRRICGCKGVDHLVRQFQSQEPAVAEMDFDHGHSLPCRLTPNKYSMNSACKIKVVPSGSRPFQPR
ncbi:hypothetical protein [Brucella anthropi]|uniref:hypothetical protein n=1 Tax=Brucella anthropi TaxID=529 RepID=UPI001CFCAE63|nr:hypothetical protein [Brucella anthropi]